MKKLLFLTITVLSMSFAAFAQANTDLNVTEYFLGIPNQYIKAAPIKRGKWVDFSDNDIGNLTFKIPAKEVVDNPTEDMNVFGAVQIFKKDAGGVVVGMTTNMCAEKICVGQILFLDYNNGKWDDITGDLAPMIDNDEVAEVLKDAPAYKKPIKKGVEIPLTIDFSGNEKAIHYLAGCETSADGGVVAKAFKWNGSTFAEFEYEESPE